MKNSNELILFKNDLNCDLNHFFYDFIYDLNLNLNFFKNDLV